MGCQLQLVPPFPLFRAVMLLPKNEQGKALGSYQYHLHQHGFVDQSALVGKEYNLLFHGKLLMQMHADCQTTINGSEEANEKHLSILNHRPVFASPSEKCSLVPVLVNQQRVGDLNIRYSNSSLKEDTVNYIGLLQNLSLFRIIRCFSKSLLPERKFNIN